MQFEASTMELNMTARAALKSACAISKVQVPRAELSRSDLPQRLVDIRGPPATRAGLVDTTEGQLEVDQDIELKIKEKNC